MEGLTLFNTAEPQRTASTLEQLERVIEGGLQTFVEVGLALLDIRDRRLYRLGHATFEDYCQKRWDFTYQRANQLIDAAKVAGALTTTVVKAPTNEAQARALAPLLRTEPEAIPVVWQEVQEEAAVVRRRRLVARCHGGGLGDRRS